MEQIKNVLRESPVARWGVLLLISYVMAANYYVYDALVPLKSALQSFLNFSSEDYGWVEGFYAFPNTFLLMAILGGIILDKIGIRITGMVFVVFMVIGALVTAYGTTSYYANGGFGHDFMSSFLPRFSPQVKMMALGMLFFGLGAETSIVVISKIIVKWFKGKEIALAFGVNLGIARIGTLLALSSLNLGPAISVSTWTIYVWLAVVIIAIALLGFLVYLVLDVKLDKQVQQEGLLDKEEEFHIKDFIGIITNRSFLYIAFLCVAFYAAVFPFLKYAPDFFHHKYGVPENTAGLIASALPFCTIFFTPIFGALVDKYGRGAFFMIIGSSMLVVAHLLFAFTNFNPYVLISLLGIAFSLVPSAMWPSVAKIVSVNKIGTAYGTMFSLQNLGLFAVPIIAGMILDKTNPHVTNEMLKEGAVLNYTPTMIMFVGFGILGMIFAFLLKRDDKTSGYGLDLPSNAVLDEKK
ncbi:MAG TPA: MFS transporter [Bacteroidales bacterium]|nr:MFS transporter [Bacteroidales bacterium]